MSGKKRKPNISKNAQAVTSAAGTKNTAKSAPVQKKRSGSGRMRGFARQLADGIWFQNPNLVLLLGMCPMLATTTTVQNAFGMGLSVTAVLICSNLVISLLRKVIPNQIRIASYIVIVAGFVTAVDLLLQAYVPALSASLGIFIPLIVVNCVILARAESYASKNPPLDSAVDGLAMGLGYTFALMIMSIIREVLGSGTLLGMDITLGAYKPMAIFIMPVGGFLTLGFVIAAVQKIMSRKPAKKAANAEKEAA